MRDRTSDRHRQVLERKLGRKLGKDEVSDHINADKHDDSPSNLRPMSRSEHSRSHSEPGRRSLAQLQKSLTMHKRGDKLY